MKLASNARNHLFFSILLTAIFIIANVGLIEARETISRETTLKEAAVTEQAFSKKASFMDRVRLRNVKRNEADSIKIESKGKSQKLTPIPTLAITEVPSTFIQNPNNYVNGKNAIPVKGQGFTEDAYIIGELTLVNGSSAYFAHHAITFIDSQNVTINFIDLNADTLPAAVEFAFYEPNKKLLSNSAKFELFAFEEINNPVISSIKPAIHMQKPDEYMFNGKHYFEIVGQGFNENSVVLVEATAPNGAVFNFTHNDVHLVNETTLYVLFTTVFATDEIPFLDVKFNVIDQKDPSIISNPIFAKVIGVNTGSNTESEFYTEVEIEAPVMNEFILQTVIPVKKGTFPREDGKMPFKFVDNNGVESPAQVDIVTKFPNFSKDGADTVQLHARVQRPQNSHAGDRVKYKVFVEEHDPIGSTEHTNSISDLTGSFIPPAIVSDLINSNTLKIKTSDAYGNPYSATLTQGHMTTLSKGDQRNALKTFNVLKPISPNANTLPHHMGVEAFLQTFANEDMLKIDLRLSNAMNGLDKTSPDDDAFDEALYWDRVQVEVPVGYVLMGTFEGPMFNPQYTLSGGKRIYDLIKPNNDGTLHLTLRQGQIPRRLMVCKDNALTIARCQAYLELQNLAFNIESFDEQGNPLPSWYTLKRFFPQKLKLSNLDHVGGGDRELAKQIIRGQLNNFYEIQKEIITYGTTGGNPEMGETYYPNYGPYHSIGSNYGGVTGTHEIDYAIGNHEIFSAERRGVLYWMILHRQYTARSRHLLLNIDGTGYEANQTLATCPTDALVYDSTPIQLSGFSVLDNSLKIGENGDVFEFKSGNHSTIDNQQKDFVYANGLKPWYEDALKNVSPIDIQHFMREKKQLIFLADILNDFMIKDELVKNSKTLRAMYTDYNRLAGWTQNYKCIPHDNSLLGHIYSTNANPGIGAAIGRLDAWALQTMLAGFNLSSSETHRNDLRHIFAKHLDMIEKAQIPCSGLFARINNDGKCLTKHNGQNTYCSRFNELGFFNQVHRAMANSVFKNVSEIYVEKAHSIMDKLAQTAMNEEYWTYHWEPNAPDPNVPYMIIASVTKTNPPIPICPDEITLEGLTFEWPRSDVTSIFGAVLQENAASSPGDVYTWAELLHYGSSIYGAGSGSMKVNPHSSNLEYYDFLRQGLEDSNLADSLE